MLQKMNWKIVVLIAVIALFVLFGGSQFYQGQQNKIIAEKLEDYPGLVAWEEKEELLHLEMEDKPDLQSLWSALELKQMEKQLKVSRGDTERLQVVLGQMKFPLQEGIERGTWIETRRELIRIAEKNRVDLELEMNSENIFLTLSDGDNTLGRTILLGGGERFD